ncbi:MAG: DUF503 domain-containing protein [Spirochaetales bacterium]|nr:DUF503 domain-containing protein [Spirochaetales bacterium]MBP7263039.1 DUF503 domain-containing protein [Spirochaetia bacterium]
MIVSMFQILLELPETSSIKDKRRIVKSIKDRLTRSFKVSCAETDLQDSLRFAQLGAALVSNSAEYGEMVMHKALGVIERDFSLRVHDSQVASERFD